MNKITVITVVAPYHRDLAQRAIDSVEAQTTRCDHLIYYDEDRRGPAYGRNALLQQVKTPFVVFLDADDWINPVYAERTLAHQERGQYVYTDWWISDTRNAAPDLPWCGGSWHVLTALIPADWARGIGGFDETLPAAEDTDFYMRLSAAGLCGLRLPEPLFHYGGEGLRAREFVNSDEYEPTMLMIRDRYKGLMGCCGDKTPNVTPPPNEEFKGAVLAMAIWGGNRQERGLATGMMYPRAGNGRQIWVDRRDVEIAPHHWRIVEVPEPVKTEIIHNENNHAQSAIERVNGVQEIGAAIARRWYPHQQQEQPATPATPATVKPDIRGIIKIAQERIGE